MNDRLNSIPLKIRKSTVLLWFQGKQKLINLFRFAKYQWNLATIPCSTWVKSKLFFHLIPDFWWNPLFTEIVITSELEMKNLKLKTLNLDGSEKYSTSKYGNDLMKANYKVISVLLFLTGFGMLWKLLSGRIYRDALNVIFSNLCGSKM